MGAQSRSRLFERLVLRFELRDHGPVVGRPSPVVSSPAALRQSRTLHGTKGMPKAVIQIDAQARTIASKLTNVGRAPARERKHTAGLRGREWLELIGQNLY